MIFANFSFICFYSMFYFVRVFAIVIWFPFQLFLNNCLQQVFYWNLKPFQLEAMFIPSRNTVGSFCVLLIGSRIWLICLKQKAKCQKLCGFDSFWLLVKVFCCFGVLFYDLLLLMYSPIMTVHENIEKYYILICLYNLI